MEPEAISDGFKEVFGLMQPVATRPAVRIACGDGMYILVLVDGEDLNDWFDFLEVECRNRKVFVGVGIINNTKELRWRCGRTLIRRRGDDDGYQRRQRVGL